MVLVVNKSIYGYSFSYAINYNLCNIILIILWNRFK